MRTFKFLRGSKRQFVKRSWLPNYRQQGQLQWMYRPVGVIFYIESWMENGFYEEEVKTLSVQAGMRYINSFNHFMAINSDKLIFALEFIDNRNLTNFIHYGEDNFNTMPKDIPLIFRGVTRQYEVF